MTTVPETAEPAAPPVSTYRTVIEPPKGWQLIDWRELWRYRELLLSFVVRNVTVRYKQTVLGVAWAVLQPAMQMAVFVVFFGRLAKVNTGDMPQPLFFLTGTLPWFFFSSALTAAATSVIGAERLITKIYFPRLAVPFSAVAAAAVDLAVAPGPELLLLPLVILLLAALAAGLGTGLAALNIVYRDFRYVVPFAVQMGMFVTPAIYLVPKGDEGRLITTLLAVNPLNPLVTGFRAAVVGGEMPWAGLAYAAAVTTVTLAAGCMYFRSQEDKFADII
jgi:lipopolysaccharide transport system permease protein